MFPAWRTLSQLAVSFLTARANGQMPRESAATLNASSNGSSNQNFDISAVNIGALVL